VLRTELTLAMTMMMITGLLLFVRVPKKKWNTLSAHYYLISMLIADAYVRTYVTLLSFTRRRFTPFVPRPRTKVAFGAFFFFFFFRFTATYDDDGSSTKKKLLSYTRACRLTHNIIWSIILH
jgi:hypothetical protein